MDQYPDYYQNTMATPSVASSLHRFVPLKGDPGREKFVKKSKPKKTSSSLVAAIPNSIQLDHISTAIAALQNNGEELKSGLSGESKFFVEPAVLKVVKGMFNPNKVYRFRLAFATTTVSDGAGKIDATINFQINTAEWGYLQILFDEVVLQSAMITCCSAAPGVPATPATPANRATLVMVSLPATQSGYSSATLAVAKADAVLVPWLSARPVKLTYKVTTDRPWCLTSDPAGTTTPTPVPSGTMGCFGLNAIGEPLTFSTTYYHLMMSNIIRLRIRA